jgi:PAS domain S-box-containing protein
MTEGSNTQFTRIERTEAALRLSEATKSAILDAALDCIVTIDHCGVVVDWNPAAERTFGYSASEAVGCEMADLIIPEPTREMHRRGLARAVSTGQDMLAGKRIEISARRKDGVEIPVELAITRIAARPNPLFTGHIRDITERKRAENALRESQQLLSSITQNIAEAIFRRSPDAGLLFVNDAYVRMFGYASVEEVQQLKPEQLYADVSRRSSIVEHLRRDGFLRNEEIEYRRKDGSTFWGLTSATGIRGQVANQILYFDGAITDITARKQAEQRQAAQYAVARALAESARLNQAAPKILQAVCVSLRWDFGALWRVERETKQLKCIESWHRPETALNEFVQATHAASFTRGIGLPGRIWKSAEPGWISDVVADKNFPRAVLALKCGLHAAFAFPICLGGDVLGVIEFFSREIREPDRQLLDMFSAIGSQIGQFIERERAETDLRQLNQDLERRVTRRTAELTQAQRDLVKALEQEKELSQMKSSFVNLVSHEFRTPLGVIVSSTDILENYYDRLKPEQRNGHLQDIRHSTQLMTGLMEEVLLLGKVEAGKMEFRPESMDLPGFCRRLVNEQLSATGHKCPILLDLKSLDGSARGDETLLRHIFTNLLSNAVKYAPPGSQVHFSVRRDAGDVVFELRDHGIGIPAEDQKRLFEAFYRAGNVGDIPGTGLGLVIVRRCVDLHNGTITVESTPGSGTTFLVRLKMFSPHIGEKSSTPRKKKVSKK